MKHHPKCSHLLTGWLPVLLCLVAVWGILVGAQPAFAVDNGPTQTGQICMQKVFGTPVSGSNRLNCSAGDIRISRAISVSPDTCTRGQKFDLTATFETIVIANARYDAGFFFRIDGGTNARGDGTNATGECSLSALTPGVTPALNPGDGDTCGDLNAGTYNLTFTIEDVLCQDSDNDGFLNLPNCTSWHNNQDTVCEISDPFAVADAVDFKPENKSKCKCDDTFQVPVTVEQATITVEKSVSPDVKPEPGGTVTYTVKITNNALVESVTISSIIDDVYGDLGDASNPNVTDNTCDDLIDDVLAPGAFTTCTFKASVSGNSGDTFTDVVEVCATQDGGGDCDDDDATVTITDVFAEPTLAKTAQSATVSCTVDVTYQVVVSNNSAVDTLDLNTLNDDKFGDITTVHAAGVGVEEVVSTTCGQSPGPGTLPATIAAGDNYTCTFDGRIVSSACAVNHTDTVTANVTDDDGKTSEPSDDATVTVSVTKSP
jgi:hypothetical protein